jgi:uncharacterized protein YbjQ (UPF0145 family)
MIETTAIDSQPVIEYVGVVTGEAVLGANIFRDLFASLGRSGTRSVGYERSLIQARETATIDSYLTATGATTDKQS